VVVAFESGLDGSREEECEKKECDDAFGKLHLLDYIFEFER